MKKTIIALLASWLLLSQCRVQLYVPTEANTAKNNVTLVNLQEGRKLYINKCSSCHNLHAPGKYSPEGWQKVLKKMQPKAKITDSQKDLIFGYLTSEIKLEKQ